MRASLKLIATFIFILSLIAIGIALYNLEFMNEFILNHSLADEKPPEIFLFYAINGIVGVTSFLLFLIIVTSPASYASETMQVIQNTDNTTNNQNNINIATDANIYSEMLTRIQEDVSMLDKTDLKKYSQLMLQIFAKHFGLVQGLFFKFNDAESRFEVLSKYAFYKQEEIKSFTFGEGISGQVAEEQKILVIDNIPDNYITILSGLGIGNPRYLTVVPIIKNNSTVAVIEMATFQNPKEIVDHVLSKINTNFLLD